MKFIVQSFFVFLFISCNNSNTSTDKNEKTTESASDSLMHEILKQHDIGMAKMNKLSQAKNRIQHNLDSISKLPFALQKKSVQYRMELDSVFNWLTFADSHMETWMNEFNMDSLKDDREKQIKYLESEKTKISHVNDEMISALRKADFLSKQ
jgi:sigma54-dependent transcription regulator